MTDPTTEPSPTPTTNEELGVVGAQNARMEAADAALRNTPQVYPPTLGVEATLAIEALTAANAVGGTPEEVADRAATYLQFLKGNS